MLRKKYPKKEEPLAQSVLLQLSDWAMEWLHGSVQASGGRKSGQNYTERVASGIYASARLTEPQLGAALYRLYLGRNL